MMPRNEFAKIDAINSEILMNKLTYECAKCGSRQSICRTNEEINSLKPFVLPKIIPDGWTFDFAKGWLCPKCSKENA